MRLVLQRVKKASVVIDGNECRAIGAGLMILLGITHDDTPEIARFMAKKTAELRIFSDENRAMNRSLLDVGGQGLVVSNFTLYANCRKGRRPSFIEAGAPKTAEPLYGQFLQALRDCGVRQVVSGEFGADMQVELINDGPVTVLLDSQEVMPRRGG